MQLKKLQSVSVNGSKVIVIESGDNFDVFSVTSKKKSRLLESLV